MALKVKTKILCTLGPASLEAQIIKRLDELGVDLFRINLSHTNLKDLSNLIQHIKAISKVPICLDTEGAQIRTGKFNVDKVKVQENKIIRISRELVVGNEGEFNFTPTNALNKIEIGDFISIDFNSVLVQVIAREKNNLISRVINGGYIGNNKAVTVDREIKLPALTQKDTEAISVGIDQGVTHFALSFANNSDDVKLIRKLTGPNCFIISKIESLSGINHLEKIADSSDALLIDRGDLSRQIPLELIPQAQKFIIKTTKKYSKPVYVATNLLESMVSNSSPTRAEINDIHNTLVDGANALVLAAETAIGNHPIACVSMVKKVIHNYENPNIEKTPSFLINSATLLVNPHGGELIQRYASNREKEDSSKLLQIEISDTSLMDCDQIAHGTYSPLTGFMDKKTLGSVLNHYRLPDGNIWTMPILLAIKEPTKGINIIGKKVALKGTDNVVYATIEVSDFFRLDLDKLTMLWFSTNSREHPGVAQVYNDGNLFIAGDIKLIKRPPSEQRHYELTPSQTRFIFSHKGWSKIVGFHTRNPVHRAHEFIQNQALDMTNADGLYINPVSGPKKTGDFRYKHIMHSYQTMLDKNLYKNGKIILGSFASYPRYSGPREAVFTALCRKNMGCSHFIVGRDHTGVGKFYEKDANQKLFKKLKDIGIVPIFFDTVYFNPKTNNYETGNFKKGMVSIDGTTIRNSLANNIYVEDWLMRKSIQTELHKITQPGETMFIE